MAVQPRHQGGLPAAASRRPKVEETGGTPGHRSGGVTRPRRGRRDRRDEGAASSTLGTEALGRDRVIGMRVPIAIGVLLLGGAIGGIEPLARVTQSLGV